MPILQIFSYIILFLVYIYIFENNNIPKILAHIFRIILCQTCYLGTVIYYNNELRIIFQFKNFTTFIDLNL